MSNERIAKKRPLSTPCGSMLRMGLIEVAINLSPAKEQVFKETYRVLRPGGELFFADVFSDRRIPEEFANDPVLRGECLGGTLYTEDFRRIMAKCGWADFRYTNISILDTDNEEIKSKLGFASFSSRTVRTFKLDDLEDICEDYGQVAYYDGSIPGHPHFFDFDDHYRFITGKPMLVCGNTASMVSKTRYGKAFKIIGDRSTHFGAFEDCGTDSGSAKVGSTVGTTVESDSCPTGSCC